MRILVHREVSMAKDCYIFGAGEESLPKRIPARDSILVIAADGGFTAALRAFNSLDLVVGDFDSLGYLPTCVPTVCHPAEKDETDLFLAVEEGLARGADRFLIYGALGARLDHTVANLQLLSGLAKRGYSAFLFGADGGIITAVAGGQTLSFPEGYTGTVSVLALGEEARGVTLTGMKYPMQDGRMTSDFPLGVSNEFAGSAASVSLVHGTLHVFFREDVALPLPAFTVGE